MASLSVTARLGYTSNQCDRKYGEWEKAVGENIRLYNVGGMQVACMFLDDACEMIRYCYGTAEPKTSEIEEILKKNGGADHWNQYEKYQWRARSRSNPKSAELYMYEKRIYLSIQTDKYTKWFREKMDKEEKERKDRSKEL